MATARKTVAPPPAAPQFTFDLPAHVDAVDLSSQAAMDCQTRDLIGSALGCAWRIAGDRVIVADGRVFGIALVGRVITLS